MSIIMNKELEFPGDMSIGDKGAGVKRLQEWLCLRGYHASIDGEFGPATRRQVKNATFGHVSIDEERWKDLTRPMRTLMTRRMLDLPTSVVYVADWHLDVHPREVGGQNMGPWVRYYMRGHEGRKYPWCAGFVSTILAQASESFGRDNPPIPYTMSCDVMAKCAKTEGLFREGKDYQPKAGDIFLIRKRDGDWVHTGFVTGCDGETFGTIEGNTNDEGSREGYEVCSRVRTLGPKVNYVAISEVG